MAKKYLEIDEQLEQLDIIDLFGHNIDNLIENLKVAQAKYKDTHYDVRIDVECGSFDNEDEFYLYGKRQETDIERDERLVKAQKLRKDKKSAKTKKDAAEIEQLKELLTKHGGDLQFDIQKLFEDQ
tara:strand:+ start:15792 stop:16169 length:378 start_codon:yes stop_codon:yes gene_type:complete